MSAKTVFIADDDANLVHVLSLRCKGLGLNVRSATTGTDTLAMVTRDPPDLLILDLDMPALDGLTLCEALVEDHQISLFPVVVLTGRDDHETVLRCVSTGAHFCLKGPDVWHALEPALRRLLELAPSVSPGDVPAPAIKPSVAGPEGDGPRVLIVDDDADFLRAMEVRLTAHGARVSTAANGKQGYWKALNEPPDIVVTDLTMPEMSGEALMRKLAFTADTAGIPIVVVTGQTFEGHEDNALRREMESRGGVVGYLTKPFGPDALIAELGRHVALRPCAPAPS